MINYILNRPLHIFKRDYIAACIEEVRAIDSYNTIMECTRPNKRMLEAAEIRMNKAIENAEVFKVALAKSNIKIEHI
jgi:hypothetical protein